MPRPNTVKMLQRVVSNPKKFPREWRIGQQELARVQYELNLREELIRGDERQLPRRVTPTRAIGWAVSPAGEAPMLVLTIAGHGAHNNQRAWLFEVPGRIVGAPQTNFSTSPSHGASQTPRFLPHGFRLAQRTESDPAGPLGLIINCFGAA
jgi:hypothetical protein